MQGNQKRVMDNPRKAIFWMNPTIINMTPVFSPQPFLQEIDFFEAS